MITFHNDSLAPPELCRLLYQTIPEELHTPVVFQSRGPTDCLGTSSDELVEINLHHIWCDSQYTRKAASRAARVWIRTLEVCYHEFGHNATREAREGIDQDTYSENLEAHAYIEKLADEWRDRQLKRLLEFDDRLAQPLRIGGYLGARLSQHFRGLKEAAKGRPACKRFLVAEVRCFRTGAQLTSKEILRMPRTAGTALFDFFFDHFRKDNEHSEAWEKAARKARKVLLSLSDGIGIDYLDEAGRNHKLYVWGDVPKLERRIYTWLSFQCATS